MLHSCTGPPPQDCAGSPLAGATNEGVRDMALIVHFSPSGLDTSKYDDAIRRLEQAGEGNPPGRLYHCCYDSGGALKVVEVWDSQQSFERHGQTLMPILKSIGIDAGQPVVSRTHNVIAGQ